MSGSFSFIVLDRKSQCMFSLQKSDNLQYNTLGPWVDRLIHQASDVQVLLLWIENKIILGTSDAWSMSHLSQRPNDPAYYIEDCRIF